MMTRYLGVAAIAVLLGVGGFGVDAVRAQGNYPDLERQHEQHERNVEQQQRRKARHRAQQQEQRVRQQEQRARQQEKMEQHGEKVRRKNQLRTEGPMEKQPLHEEQIENH
jgi:uncharacterized protein HemX